MKFLSTMSVIVMTLAGSVSALAVDIPAQHTAGHLEDTCRALTSKDEQLVQSMIAEFCLGYVKAQMDLYRLDEFGSGGKVFRVCAGGGISKFEIAEAFMDYMKRNPEKRTTERMVITFISMARERYPCPV